jgi:ABC-type dipeptide/oligopeptide/nickel transport system permease component
VNASYLIRRLLVGAGTLLAAVSLVFMMIHLIPGDPVKAILGDLYSEETAAQLTTQLGLDKPLWRQYTDFMGGLLRGDLGTSFLNRQPVLQVVLENLQFTVQLAIAGILVTIALGIPAGIFAALHRGKLADLVTMAASLIGASMPSFWLGILLMIVFAVNLKWFPLLGASDDGNPLSAIKYLVLPGLTLGVRGAALTARVTRSSMLENLGQDYTQTARAKGLAERVVIYQHALRNALLPVVTVVGIDLGRMLGGAAIVEIVFSRPGLGTLLVGAVLDRDYPLIQGAFVVYLIMIILVNLLVDLVYARIDPRVSYA